MRKQVNGSDNKVKLILIGNMSSEAEKVKQTDQRTHYAQTISRFKDGAVSGFITGAVL